MPARALRLRRRRRVRLTCARRAGNQAAARAHARSREGLRMTSLLRQLRAVGMAMMPESEGEEEGGGVRHIACAPS